MLGVTDLGSTAGGGALAISELVGVPDDEVLATPAWMYTAVNSVNSVMHPFLKILQYSTEPILPNVIPLVLLLM